MKSQADLEKLKKLWLEDPEAFKLEEVEGYEAHRQELLAFVRQHQDKRNAPPDFISGFIPMAVESMMSMLGGLNRKSGEDLLDDTATILLRQLVKDMPDYLDPATEEQYYRKIGVDVYRRAHFILLGRNEFALRRCPCTDCQKKRETEEKAKGNDGA